MEYLLLTLTVLLAASAQILKKHGMGSFGRQHTGFVTALRNPLVIAGMLCQVSMAVLWLGVLARMEVGLAYPALSLGFVLVILWSRIVLGEQVPTTRWLGVGLIVGGVGLVSLGGAG